MIVKSLPAAAAAVLGAGAVAAGVSLLAPVGAVAPGIQPVVFGAPLPQAPAADVPTAEELAGVLNGLADPSVPFANKGGLVEGGVAPGEASMADHKLHKAARKGALPLSFSVANVEPAGPGAATADVTVTGPQMPPLTTNIGFVNQDGWKLSRTSVAALLQAV